MASFLSADFHIFSVGFFNPVFNIVDNCLGLLIPGIVGSDDRQIRQPAGYLSHFKAPLPCAVAAAAKKADSLWG